MVSAIKQRSAASSSQQQPAPHLVSRYKDNKEGRMNSLLFMYIETETEKLSGHIDLTARCPQPILS